MASRNPTEKVPARLRRLGSEFTNALKAALLPELQEHTKLLLQHSAPLNRHEETLQGVRTVLREQAAILRDHSEPLARFESRIESLERIMDQGFRLLSDRMGDLSDGMGELAEQVRDNLQLRDRVTKIEARLGLMPSS
jgi:hypothetical protein